MSLPLPLPLPIIDRVNTTLISYYKKLVLLTMVSTRKTNKTQHPGAVDVSPKRKHCTSAQVAAERFAAAAEKQTKEADRVSKLQEVAVLENEMAEKEAADKASSRDPPARRRPRAPQPVASRRTRGCQVLEIQSDQSWSPSPSVKAAVLEDPEDAIMRFVFC